jgi:branched-chain amino acid transport system substrate-binding protein
MKKLISLALVLIGLIAIFAGVPTAAKTELTLAEPVRVGIIGPLTGGVAVYGIAATNGAKLALDEINAAGGIGGQEVKYFILDEKGDPTEAVNAFRKLVEDEKIDVLIGDVTSKPSLAVAQEAAKINLPMITPTGTAENVTEAGENVFRTCFIDTLQGKVMGNFAVTELGLKKIAVIYNASSDYSEGLKDAFVEEAKAQGAEIIEPEAYNDGDVDFNVQLTKIAQAQPDGLYVPDYYDVDLQLITQARMAGIEGPVLGGDGWDGVLEVAGDNPEDADGAYFSNHYAADNEEENLQNFLKNYRETFDMEANSFAALGYDSAYIVKEAIERAGSIDRAELVTALAATDYSGVTGNISFDEKRNPVKTVWVISIEEGTYKLFSKVEPEAKTDDTKATTN